MRMMNVGETRLRKISLGNSKGDAERPL